MRLKTSKQPHTHGDKPMSVINNVNREAYAVSRVREMKNTNTQEKESSLYINMEWTQSCVMEASSGGSLQWPLQGAP